METKERPKEHGVLFADRLVPKVLSGQKTQTRRPLRKQPRERSDGSWEMPIGRSRSTTNWRRRMVYSEATGVLELDEQYLLPLEEWLMELCPYRPGDVMWGRETWTPAEPGPLCEGMAIAYRADFANDPHGYDGEKSPEGRYRTWRPSIHMPRWASRMVYPLTDVRVKRIQDITPADAYAEGIEYINGRYTWNGGLSEHRAATDAFAESWNSIYPGSWEANSWVWVLDWGK